MSLIASVEIETGKNLSAEQINSIRNEEASKFKIVMQSWGPQYCGLSPYFFVGSGAPQSIVDNALKKLGSNKTAIVTPLPKNIPEDYDYVVQHYTNHWILENKSGGLEYDPFPGFKGAKSTVDENGNLEATYIKFNKPQKKK